MTGLDKDIFRATRHLTTLLNEACNYWNYLCPYLEKLAVAADRALVGYQKDYPDDVNTIIAEDRKTAIRPLRNCDFGTAEEQAQRFYAFCQAHLSEIDGMCSDTCPCLNCGDKCHCLCKWSQMPYEPVKTNKTKTNKGE